MFTNKTPWVVLLVLWMAGSTWWHVCQIKQLCPNGVSAVTTTNPAADRTPLTIADGDRFRLELPGNFSFAKSEANANLNALGESADGNALDQLTAYLKANPNRILEITGYYTSTEKNTTSLANLGLARAEGIRQYLVQQGIPAASLSTKGELEESLAFSPKGDSLYGGLTFAFSGEASAPPGEPTASADSAQPVPAETETDLTTTTPPGLETVAAGISEEGLAAAEKYTSVFEPIDLYFALGESNYIKTPATRQFFEEAARYLAEHKDKKLLVTGHTDNSGEEEVNRQLSRDRARQVKRRLVELKINDDQVIVDAKGEAEPKASNDTREGRKANRRVTVVVQK